MAYYRLRSGAPAPSQSYKKRRTASTQSTQQQLALLKRKVNQLKPETKCTYVSGQLANVATGVGSISYLSQIAQGVTKQARLGDQIRLTRIQFRIQCIDSQSNATGNLVSRIMIVKDKSATGVIPSIAGASNSVLTAASTLSMQLPNTLDRFVVLKDMTYNGNQVVNGDIQGEFWFDMKCNTVMDYLDTGAAIGSAGSNSLFVIVVTDNTAATSDWNYVANLYFTDV